MEESSTSGRNFDEANNPLFPILANFLQSTPIRSSFIRKNTLNRMITESFRSSVRSRCAGVACFQGGVHFPERVSVQKAVKWAIGEGNQRAFRSVFFGHQKTQPIERSIHSAIFPSKVSFVSSSRDGCSSRERRGFDDGWMDGWIDGRREREMNLQIQIYSLARISAR